MQSEQRPIKSKIDQIIKKKTKKIGKRVADVVKNCGCRKLEKIAHFFVIQVLYLSFFVAP